MRGLLEIPREVRDPIISHCHLPQLVDLSATCRQLRSECAIELAAKRQECDDLQKRLRNSMEPFSKHRLLLRILTYQFPAQAITKLYVGDYFNIEDDFTEPNLLYKKDSPDPDEFDGIRGWQSLIRQDVAASPWIDADAEDALANAACIGDEDATVAILLPHLCNLRLLDPPLTGQWTGRILARIAHAQSEAAQHNTTAPLQRLVMLTTAAANGEHGCGVNEDWFKSIIGLRSLKRIEADHCWGKDVCEWPSDLVRPVCPEIFMIGSVSAECVESLASAWDAPCVMRQRFRTMIDWVDERDPQWQFCYVRRRTDDPKSFDVTLEMEEDWDGVEDLGDWRWMRSPDFSDLQRLIHYNGSEDGVAPNALKNIPYLEPDPNERFFNHA